MEASRILNVELIVKIALLEKETNRYKDLAKANTNLTTDLAALHEQMEWAKADIVAGVWTFHPYYDECGNFYGDSFDDCLKQVVALYPHLDSS